MINTISGSITCHPSVLERKQLDPISSSSLYYTLFRPPKFDTDSKYYFTEVWSERLDEE
jgi:hypothetical protein